MVEIDRVMSGYLTGQNMTSPPRSGYLTGLTLVDLTSPIRSHLLEIGRVPSDYLTGRNMTSSLRSDLIRLGRVTLLVSYWS